MPETRGHVAYEGPFPSRALGADRPIRVYLPPSYHREGTRRFPVLYVHDGQNAFTTAGDWVAYGWGNWRLDQTVNELAVAGHMQEIIMVAIDCGKERYREYRGPAYPYRNGSNQAKKRHWAAPADNSRYEAYRRFLVRELKPAIDQQYRTRPGPKTTGVLGSSMGGICSLALAWDSPRVFGLAASLSGSYQIERRVFLTKVLRQYQRRAKPIRVYLDSGVVDDNGGDDGQRDTASVVDELRRIGWREPDDLMHFVDAEPLRPEQLESSGLPQGKWAEAQTSQHNEFYWRRRVWRALTFLFPALNSAHDTGRHRR